ncbi:ama1 protein [Trypanosoma theileri]|uniref:Ama1 protein n=1 Tax=Trypanosoma theileri TaxID=67003 RepID=A0A1X0NEC8_9TRYP|nr:ama1 protein [Trypanosoma theileri]ORC76762.1 ama1 protein [Trypanosoma theileri]
MASKNTESAEGGYPSYGNPPGAYVPPIGTVVMPNTGPTPAQPYTPLPQSEGGPKHGTGPQYGTGTKHGTGTQYGGGPYYGAPPPAQRRDWQNGLCVCCGDCDSCLESWCCYYCQLSRQYNLLYENIPSINWAVAMGALLGDYCLGCLVSTVVQCMLRARVRQRLSLQGSDCDDACMSLCCSYCSLQQSLLELTDAGLFPGACCYNKAPGSRTME